VDLSAIIFVVLALAWAAYLIPKALKHHDELASDRLVEGHSDRVRILSRHGRAAKAVVVPDAPIETPAQTPVEVARPSAVPAPVATRAVARKAARRRRRVLSVLVLALAVVTGLAGFAIVPWWSTAAPGAMVLLFLVVARLSVRTMQRRRRTAPARVVVERAVTETVDARLPGSEAPAGATVDTADETSGLIDRLSDEGTAGASRQEIEAALADDGSLWDPLPVTLPTYVNKARARRTVRTIELTGINSSGHDQADSSLARDAAEKTEAAKESGGGERKVAGA
jgi:hypothetical protein